MIVMNQAETLLVIHEMMRTKKMAMTTVEMRRIIAVMSSGAKLITMVTTIVNVSVRLCQRIQQNRVQKRRILVLRPPTSSVLFRMVQQKHMPKMPLHHLPRQMCKVTPHHTPR